jgi:hypothetical protein
MVEKRWRWRVIKLTLLGLNGDPCYVKPESVDAVYRVSSGPVTYSLLVVAGGAYTLSVTEDTDEVIKRLTEDAKSAPQTS